MAATIKKAIFLPGSFVAGGGPRPRPAKVTRKEKKEPKKEPKAMTKEERRKELERLLAALQKEEAEVAKKKARIQQLQELEGVLEGAVAGMKIE